jgi:hypothetical protein
MGCLPTHLLRFVHFVASINRVRIHLLRRLEKRPNFIGPIVSLRLSKQGSAIRSARRMGHGHHPQFAEALKEDCALWDNELSIMPWCCKSCDVTTPKVLVIEERIRAFLLRPTPWMHWFVRILYAVVVLLAVLGLSMRIFK